MGVFQFLPSKIAYCNKSDMYLPEPVFSFQFLPSKIAYCNEEAANAAKTERTFQFLPSKIAYCNGKNRKSDRLFPVVSIPTLENR